ncbi:hypothetical protein GQ53DRAFT_835678 [Thozetella sp. PMI_491]|nr:hypothetical protein GQ53DRAFT_835678 [Thozetella sp. PMI_491]
MDSAAEELRRRRDRGKLSQRAFRRRQAAATRKLKLENEQFRAVIRDLSNAVRTSDRLELRDIVKKAATTAGVGMDLADEETRYTDTSSSSSNVATARFPVIAATEEPQRCGSELMPLGPKPSLIVPIDLPPPAVSGRMSPRLSYGLCSSFSGLGHIVEPPTDIVPYLGQGMYTLAGHIYWICIETTLELLYHFRRHQLRTWAYPVLQHPMFARMLQFVTNTHTLELIIAMAEARVQFSRTGRCRGDNLAADRDSGQLLMLNAEHEARKDGVQVEEWVGPAMVEWALSQRLKPDQLARLEAAVGGTSPGPTTKRTLEEFNQKLMLSYVCFGDGPRWRISEVTPLLIELAEVL